MVLFEKIKQHFLSVLIGNVSDHNGCSTIIPHFIYINNICFWLLSTNSPPISDWWLTLPWHIVVEKVLLRYLLMLHHHLLKFHCHMRRSLCYWCIPSWIRLRTMLCFFCHYSDAWMKNRSHLLVLFFTVKILLIIPFNLLLFFIDLIS